MVDSVKTFKFRSAYPPKWLTGAFHQVVFGWAITHMAWSGGRLTLTFSRIKRKPSYFDPALDVWLDFVVFERMGWWTRLRLAWLFLTCLQRNDKEQNNDPC
jgi:hypothetical protein